jgi:hypothetical protein
MAGPWERYAPREEEPTGPWSRFAAEAPAEQAPPPETTGREAGFLPFVNRGVARALGLPVDVANAALGAVGLPVSPQPFGGSASIESGLARFGRAVGAPMVPQVGQIAETPSEYIGQGIGEAAGMLNPAYAGARLAAAASRPLVARIGESAARAPVAAPVTTTGLELAAGAGAGGGRYVAEQNFPNNPAASALGELAGGLSVGALAAAPSLLARLPGAQAAQAAIAPFTPAGAEARAARRLTSLVPDAGEAARAAEAPTISNLTPAQRTGDTRLLALERAVADENPAIAQQLQERATAAQRTLEEEARLLGGDPTQTRAFLEGRVTRLTDALNTRVEQAQSRAQQRIAALEPTAPADAASRIAREEFDKAYDAARAQENILWRSIPDDVRIDTAPLFERFAALVDATPRTQRHNIPDYAKRFLGREAPDEQAEAVTSQLNLLYPGAFPQRAPSQRLGAAATPAELQGLRSELLDIERTARDAGRRNEARIAGQIADDVLATLNSVPETAGPYAVARDFSRNLNEVFRGGGVAPLARTAGGSEPRVAPELTLETLLGSGGPRADVAARDLLVATGNSPETRQAISDYLVRSFRDRAVSSEGRIRPESAEGWLRRNEALLARFPEIRTQVTEAISAQGQAGAAAARQTAVERGLQRPADSAVARFLGADPGEEAARVFSAREPATVAASLRRSVERDPSGQALAGLRGAFIDELFSRARQTTPDGTVLRGSSIMASLDDPGQAAALRQVFDAPSLNRLRQIGAELTALERARGTLPSVGGVIQDTPAKVVEIIGRVVAARTAAAVGGDTGLAGGLQSAQIASSNMRQFLNNLTNDGASRLLSRAVTDPELFATLMSPTRTARQQDVAARRLQAWLAGTAGGETTGEETERAPPPANMMPPRLPPALPPAPAMPRPPAPGLLGQ